MQGLGSEARGARFEVFDSNLAVLTRRHASTGAVPPDRSSLNRDARTVYANSDSGSASFSTS
jgi:hypothetical protein